MFTLFQTIAASLGYVSLSATIKNRIYTILATVGNFYLLYVSYRFFRNGFPLRGALFILAFLGIAYFCYLNIFYYFTNKTAKYDLSAKIAEALHIQVKDPLSDTQDQVNAGPGFVQTNGIFADEEFLPATLEISAVQSGSIQAVAKALEKIDYFHANYGGLSDKQLFKQLQNGSQTEAPKLVEPVALPYFEMRQKGDKLVVYGGLNQMRALELATIKTIGLLPAREAVKNFDVFLATTVLTAGPCKKAARQSLVELDRPYQIDVRIAYKKKGEPVPGLHQPTPAELAADREKTGSTKQTKKIAKQTQETETQTEHLHRRH